MPSKWNKTTTFRQPSVSQLLEPYFDDISLMMHKITCRKVETCILEHRCSSSLRNSRFCVSGNEGITRKVTFCIGEPVFKRQCCISH